MSDFVVQVLLPVKLSFGALVIFIKLDIWVHWYRVCVSRPKFCEEEVHVMSLGKGDHVIVNVYLYPK